MLLAVSVLAIPVLLFDVAEHPCNWSPVKIAKPNTSNHVLRCMFIIDT